MDYTDTWGNHRIPSKDFKRLKTKSQCATWIFMCRLTNVGLSHNPVLVHLRLKTKRHKSQICIWLMFVKQLKQKMSLLAIPQTNWLVHLFTFGSVVTDIIPCVAQLELSKDCTFWHWLHCTLYWVESSRCHRRADLLHGTLNLHLISDLVHKKPFWSSLFELWCVNSSSAYWL